MSPESLTALALFALVSSITPGPNNLMLLASGANFGFRSSLPHMVGISLGFMGMALLVGLGLAQVFERVPALAGWLKWLGVAYMLYLAWRVARAGAPGEGSAGRGRPLGFWGAAAFQWVNPKAWMMALGTFGTYVPATQGWAVIAAAAALFAAINLPSVAVWALFGSALRGLLQSRRNALIFNHAMAALLLASLYPVLQSH
jgi:threonine/homoserine/homoserine lactone efflux protein